MDPAELTSAEWSSLSGLYTAEEAEFMSQLLDNSQVPEHLYGNLNLEIPSTLWPGGHESTIVSVTGINNSTSHFPQNSDISSNTDFLSFLQGSCSIANTSNIFPTTTSGGNYCLNDPVANIGYMSMVDAKFSPYKENNIQQINANTYQEFGLEVIGDKNFQAHKECEVPVSEPVEEDTRTTNNLESSGKRSRSSVEGPNCMTFTISETKSVPKNKRNVKSGKKPKSALISNTEEDRSPGLEEQSLNSEDDDAKASLELNAGGSSSLSPKDSTALKLKGKPISNRGSATDLQCVYAKRRRERINERLKILQNLVPNGTKVDISTMLEEAVQYVKFLQLQIKLLSSDLWMYAPIAYNGINIGLDLNITPTKQPYI